MKIQISNGMLLALIINMVYSKALGLTQGIMAREVGGDMWTATIFSTIQGCIMMVMTTLVIRRAPKLDFMGHTEKLIGKWAGKIVALILFLFFTGAYFTVMITYVYHLMDYFLPEMPAYLFLVVSFLIGCYGVFSGLEVIGRLAFVGVFFIIVFNILLMFGTIKEFDSKELLPILESGFWRTIWASRQNDTDWAMATIMAGVILPNVKDNNTWTRSGIAGILIGGLLVLQWPILEAAVLSPEVTKQYIVACMQMARSAHIGQFIQRYELFMVVFFAFSLLVQMSICLFCACRAVGSIFNLKSYRTVIIPVGLILNGAAYWIIIDHTRAMNFLEGPWVVFSLSVAFGLPLLLWGSGFLFKRKLQEANANT
ncbi:GerAB/ArcD/ProY family transporter [Neobacillus sp. PS3-12]|uniref:GerAB/ArcD/ProY family transporter n=1 Tax=Neobacillus sp. PS3-12 TaxID=3070677 RepID=UPI0027E11EEB|nr:GerAB/ArcD/ProY family transporter [Neobacillus sp. PS3-12]WML53595.1 GerAB/ArcD/ProY family transporter [Neobacillus sp. PS3-12]